jgi:hypothetical protein
MGNYNTLFSFVMALPNAQAIDYAMNLAALAETMHSQSEEDRNLSETNFPTELEFCLDDWCFEVDKNESGIWIHSDSSGADAACDFVQHLLARFGIEEPVGFEWANTCSKPCLDAFGGGAVIITATEIRSWTSFAWLTLQPGFVRQERNQHDESD